MISPEPSGSISQEPVPGLLMRMRRYWCGVAPATRRLLAARFWRSLSQGALVVDLSLYLHALGWTGAAIGGVLTGGGVFGASMSLLVGVTSDRLRRKPFLLAYEGLTCLCAITALATASPLWLAPVIVLAGFGRGANGSAGPFSPAEQAWLAEAVDLSERGLVYSLNTSFGFLGMALGAMAAALPPLWRDSLGAALSFRPLFGLVLLGNAVNLALVAGTPEVRRTRPLGSIATSGDPAEELDHARENRFLVRLMGLNALNGLAIGLVGPLIAYWFALRFHVGPEAIGPVMAVTFLLTAASSFFMGLMSRRVGLVRAVQWGRSAGLAFLALMPVMPLYSLAALLYILRSTVNRGTVGARQALVVSVVRDERRGLAVSLNALSMMVPMSVGPALAGAMIGAGWFVTPFYIATGLQALYVFFYGTVFTPFEQAAMATNSD
jgi:MFS family permease